MPKVTAEDIERISRDVKKGYLNGALIRDDAVITWELTAHIHKK